MYNIFLISQTTSSPKKRIKHVRPKTITYQPPQSATTTTCLICGGTDRTKRIGRGTKRKYECLIKTQSNLKEGMTSCWTQQFKPIVAFVEMDMDWWTVFSMLRHLQQYWKITNWIIHHVRCIVLNNANSPVLDIRKFDPHFHFLKSLFNHDPDITLTSTQHWISWLFFTLSSHSCSWICRTNKRRLMYFKSYLNWPHGYTLSYLMLQFLLLRLGLQNTKVIVTGVADLQSACLFLWTKKCRREEKILHQLHPSNT